MITARKQRNRNRVGVKILVAMIFGLGLLFAPVVRSQIPTSISVQAQRIGVSGGGEVVYRLSASSGPSPSAFGFEYQLPSWPTPKLVLGSPIAITSVSLNSPGSIRPATSPGLPKPRLEREEVCLRGRPSSFATAYWIEVPANSTVLIELRGRRSYPSWPTTRYDLKFSTFEVDDPTAVRSPLRTVSVSPPGVKGMHILIRAVQAKGRGNGPRMTPEIAGRTDPVLKFARILLRAVRPSLSGSVSLNQWAGSSPESVVLGRVRTDKHGRFRLLPQRFPFMGRYAVLARSEARPGLAADWNCGPFF